MLKKPLFLFMREYEPKQTNKWKSNDNSYGYMTKTKNLL